MDRPGLGSPANPDETATPPIWVARYRCKGGGIASPVLMMGHGPIAKVSGHLREVGVFMGCVKADRRPAGPFIFAKSRDSTPARRPRGG